LLFLGHEAEPSCDERGTGWNSGVLLDASAPDFLANSSRNRATHRRRQGVCNLLDARPGKSGQLGFVDNAAGYPT
jgi:hypothetical protein